MNDSERPVTYPYLNLSEPCRECGATDGWVCGWCNDWEQGRDEALAMVEALQGALGEVLPFFKRVCDVVDGLAEGVIMENATQGKIDSLSAHLADITDVLTLVLTPPAALAELEARVRGEERERCAVIAENLYENERYIHFDIQPDGMGREIAAAIREADDD